MAQPTDWLGPFLEQELRAVITWKDQIEATPKARRDPESRFSDDGSNFRNDIQTSDLPNDARVQIFKILSTEDPVTLLITDGFTKLKARLSENAVTVLETEIDERIDQDTRGDVFTIKDATVISTPFGPSDGFIQLAILDIKYDYHLRKRIGQPKAIEDREETQRLIECIANLRKQQYASRESSPDPLSLETGPGASRETERHEAHDGNNTPQSQRSLAPSQASPITTQRSPNTQLPIATQVPTQRKAPGPTLSKDGFEIAKGVNLARPIGAAVRVNTRPLSPGSGHRPTSSEGKTNKKLLSLLGKRKAEEPLPPPAPLSERARPTTPRHTSPCHAPPSRPPQARAADSTPNQASRDTNPPSQAKPPAKPAPGDYTRRRIPRDQQKLLDQASSWLPSLPGKSFPQPNIPIELLTRWNTQISAEARKNESVESPDNNEVQDEEEGAPTNQEASEDDSDSSSEASSDDEELSASQWPATPSQRKPILPPDSTMGSPKRVSPVQRREERPPDSSQKSARNTHDGNLKQIAGSSSQRMVQALRKRPFWIPVTTGEDESTPAPASQRPGSSNSANSGFSAPQRTSTPQDNGTHHSRIAHSPMPQPDQSRQPSSHAASSQHTNNSNAQIANSSPAEKSHQPIHDELRHQDLSRSPTTYARQNNHAPPSRQPGGGDGEHMASSQPRGTSPPPNEQTSNPAPLESPVQQPQQIPQPASSAISTPKKSTPARPPAETLVNKTPTSVVKGTQLNGDEGDMEMEMSVPRSLDRDPVEMHRQKRSEHFKGEQRRGWIERNYISDPQSTFPFVKIYQAYKKGYPKDTSLKLSDLAEAIEEVYGSGARLKPRQPTPPPNDQEDDVASTLHSSRPSNAADLDGAEDKTPTRVVTERTVKGQRNDGMAERKRVSMPARPTSSSVFAQFARPASSAPATPRNTAVGNGATPSSSAKRRLPWTTVSTPQNRSSQARSSLGRSSLRESTTTTTTPNGIPPAASAPSQAHRPNGVPALSAKESSNGTRRTEAEENGHVSVPPPAESGATTERAADERNANGKRRRNNGSSSPVFHEFAQAWKRLRPSGAFADEGKRGGDGYRVKRQLDVLGWEV